MGGFALRYVDQTGGVAPDGAWAADAAAAWQFAGFDPRPVRLEVRVRFAVHHGRLGHRRDRRGRPAQPGLADRAGPGPAYALRRWCSCRGRAPSPTGSPASPTPRCRRSAGCCRMGRPPRRGGARLPGRPGGGPGRRPRGSTPGSRPSPPPWTAPGPRRAGPRLREPAGLRPARRPGEPGRAHPRGHPRRDPGGHQPGADLAGRGVRRLCRAECPTDPAGHECGPHRRPGAPYRPAGTPAGPDAVRRQVPLTSRPATRVPGWPVACSRSPADRPGSSPSTTPSTRGRRWTRRCGASSGSGSAGSPSGGGPSCHTCRREPASRRLRDLPRRDRRLPRPCGLADPLAPGARWHAAPGRGRLGLHPSADRPGQRLHRPGAGAGLDLPRRLPGGGLPPRLHLLGTAPGRPPPRLVVGPGDPGRGGGRRDRPAGHPAVRDDRTPSLRAARAEHRGLVALDGRPADLARHLGGDLVAAAARAGRLCPSLVHGRGPPSPA